MPGRVYDDSQPAYRFPAHGAVALQVAIKNITKNSSSVFLRHKKPRHSMPGRVA